MKVLVTISNPHVESWLNESKAKTGKTPQEVIRDLLYVAMLNDKGVNTGIPDRVWGEKN
jgi:hypothetical protein